MKFYIQENPSPSAAYQRHLEIRCPENNLVAVMNGANDKCDIYADIIVSALQKAGA